MQERNLVSYFTSKALDGYFCQVLTINPISDFSESPLIQSKATKYEIFKFDEVHTLIEGKINRFAQLRSFPKVNFLLSQISFFRFLKKYISHQGFDFIRAEDPRYSGLWGLLLRKYLGIPLLIGCWGNPDTNRALLGKPIMPKLYKKISIEKRFEGLVLRRGDKCLAQNRDNLQYILDSGVPEKKSAIFKLGNGLSGVHFTDPLSRAFPKIFGECGKLDGHTIIVTVGQLEPRKLYEDTLKVIELVNRIHPVKLIAIGNGSEHDKYVLLAQNLGIFNNVFFVGNRSQVEIASMLAYADIVLSPLTGRALSEACLAGAPIVAYDIDCHPDLIKSGETGELVKYRDIQEMANATLKLIEDRAHAKQLGINARKFTLDFMDPDTINKHQINIYESLR